jgi:hypothetical protein
MVAPNLFAAYDGTLIVNGSGYENGQGGEFRVVSPIGTFQTFCIEDQEWFLPGATYKYYKNTGAVAGGVGADTTDLNTGIAMDNISIGTAWLYSQFRAGTLANYFGVNRQANAGVLQTAIWMLEGEVDYNAANPYLGQARTALGMTDAQLVGDSGGAYNVVALNLFDGPPGSSPTDKQGTGGVTYHLNQDQLAIVPEPTTMVAGIGALGLVLLGLRRRSGVLKIGN